VSNPEFLREGAAIQERGSRRARRQPISMPLDEVHVHRPQRSMDLMPLNRGFAIEDHLDHHFVPAHYGWKLIGLCMDPAPIKPINNVESRSAEA
jgi:hypothetical protein